MAKNRAWTFSRRRAVSIVRIVDSSRNPSSKVNHTSRVVLPQVRMRSRVAASTAPPFGPFASIFLVPTP